MEMTLVQRIDAVLDGVLRASGNALDLNTSPLRLHRMREAMCKVMAYSYIAGSDACHNALKANYDRARRS